jgi:hypothetical protein
MHPPPDLLHLHLHKQQLPPDFNIPLFLAAHNHAAVLEEMRAYKDMLRRRRRGLLAAGAGGKLTRTGTVGESFAADATDAALAGNSDEKGRSRLPLFAIASAGADYAGEGEGGAEPVEEGRDRTTEVGGRPRTSSILTRPSEPSYISPQDIIADPFDEEEEEEEEDGKDMGREAAGTPPTERPASLAAAAAAARHRPSSPAPLLSSFPIDIEDVSPYKRG